MAIQQRKGMAFRRDGIYSYRISPNPTSNTLNVTIEEKTKEKNEAHDYKEKSIREIMIIDKMRNLIVRKTYLTGTRNITLAINHLKSDIYSIRIYDGSKWTSQKFIK